MKGKTDKLFESDTQLGEVSIISEIVHIPFDPRQYSAIEAVDGCEVRQNSCATHITD